LFCLALAYKKQSWPSTYADLGESGVKEGEIKSMHNLHQRLLQLAARSLTQNPQTSNIDLNISLQNCLKNTDSTELDLLLHLTGANFSLPGIGDTLHKLDSYKTKVVVKEYKKEF